MSKFVLLQGDEACALGAIKAGCRFFAGYPITPATEIAETMAKELPKVGGTFIQMEDEIASAAAIVGASLAGEKAMTATSGPGFSLMQEVIGYASMVEAPTVFVNVQRGDPSTGMPTKIAQGDIMQSRWGTHGDHPVIAIYPSTVEEVYRYIVTAFNYAEHYRTPVVFLMDEVLGHMRESLYLPPDSELKSLPRAGESVLEDDDIFQPFIGDDQMLAAPLIKMGKSRFHVSGLVHDESGFPVGAAVDANRLLRRLDHKIRLHADEINICDEYMTEDAEILIVAYGSVARSALRAVKIAREDKINVGLFRPITIWPFPATRLRQLLKKTSAVIVVEMNLGQIVYEVSRLNRRGTKLELLSKVNGELVTPQEILDTIAKVKSEVLDL
ncbi:2-oxoglutarate ferredoxin oxidoreductase subunit alpha [Kosmotoga arenicorallina S304]|uniref:2-oxoglutarate ferredoxin oxidoreductase subunit alpha n=1 Tax=Kosmotoga arenicorallina S304 TaxID=1453497 RepID=A0A176K0I4_9BACT|nr:2-oxoacid:acceptor oxidoreductase subunit alpha [Kosmotoga arenicorallina]OAA29759.1 2-oxoglutarate ferredoxin oxidoreductase subunit alpha [Kosmotoga arenicorallina S304]